MIFITSYNRPKMLLRLLKELEGESVVVVDDGSDYIPYPHALMSDYYRLSHKGKIGYWLNWNFMLKIAHESNDNEFIFIPDDIYNIDLVKLRADYSGGALNILNVGADRGWTPKGYVDCAFMCDRKTLEQIGYLNPVDIELFQIPGISSGVGLQISQKLYRAGVDMHMGNYATHGTHESQMHPLERLRNPLSNE